MRNAIDSLFIYLPPRISKAVSSLPNGILEAATEIRLRKNSPVSITSSNRNITFDELGRVCNIRQAMRASEGELFDCVRMLTDGSLYTCDEYLKKGFIPLPSGARVGVTGRSNALGGWAEITALNLRIQRFLPNVASELIKKYACDGIKGALVCAPPAMGKTTFLKSAAYLLANGQGIAPKRVGIADERGEIYTSIPDGGLIDPCVFIPKAEGISMLTRVMSPEIIICDEISASEVDAVNEAQSSGVALIASVHCESVCELLNRGRMRALADPTLFPLCVYLSFDKEFKCEICETEALL